MDINIKKYLAEFLGTAVLVLIGCGAVTIGGYAAGGAAGIAIIALAFGLAVMAMIYTIGPISGCHINPAVTIGVWAAGRMPTSLVPGYIIAQILGGLAGMGLLLLILGGKAGGYDVAINGLGQNGWGPNTFGQYATHAAIITEFLATLIFLLVILKVTAPEGGGHVSGLVIGLTLAALIFTFITVTGVSVNPARSLAPAVFVGGAALQQVWLFLLVPSLAGWVAGMLVKKDVL